MFFVFEFYGPPPLNIFCLYLAEIIYSMKTLYAALFEKPSFKATSKAWKLWKGEGECVSTPINKIIFLNIHIGTNIS